MLLPNSRIQLLLDNYYPGTGTSLPKGRDKQVIDLMLLETPLGTMIAGAFEEGVCLLEFTDRRMLETEFEQLSQRLKASFTMGSNEHLEMLHLQLDEYFAGKRKKFAVSLHAPGTEFQRAVWAELQNIPFGTTRSYKQQALVLKKPEAVRAVARANGMNRIAIVIPCHRVIGDDGSLTGYGGGLWRKQWLLEFEGAGTLRLM
jgi:AraC family transcriptional regulator of adaptative response/methylated-DNA-[protein]-cysteine methyltransferase